MRRNTSRLGIGVVLGVLTIGLATLALAQEGVFADTNSESTDTTLDDTRDSELPDVDEGDGPPWLRDGAGEWQPGDAGPPPWSNARFLRDDAAGWMPGDGKPPWADGSDDDAEDDTDDDGEGPPWTRDGAGDWQPGDGKPPWAGNDDGDA